MARTYDMTRRTQAAGATRAEIIAAAQSLLERPDGGLLSLQDVAAAAGVSRATVYNRVGSRRELLIAVFEDQGRRIHYDRVLAAMKHPDLREAVTSMVRESCRAWTTMPVAIRRTLALAVLDAEVGEVVNRFEGYRRRELAPLAQRVASGGTQDVTTAEAVLALHTSFGAFDHLRFHLSAEEATERLTGMSLRALGLEPMTEDSL